MEIESRSNTVTLTINLDNWDSVRQALDFIRAECKMNHPTGDILTNKIKLIKLVRAFGEQVAASAKIEADPDIITKVGSNLPTVIVHDKGLRAAKIFVENSLDRREVRVV